MIFSGYDANVEAERVKLRDIFPIFVNQAVKEGILSEVMKTKHR